jgi:hypothetical protein
MESKMLDPSNGDLVGPFVNLLLILGPPDVLLGCNARSDPNEQSLFTHARFTVQIIFSNSLYSHQFTPILFGAVPGGSRATMAPCGQPKGSLWAAIR